MTLKKTIINILSNKTAYFICIIFFLLACNNNTKNGGAESVQAEALQIDTSRIRADLTAYEVLDL